MIQQHVATVVMPTAHRPEFCALALEQLAKASHCPQVYVFVDDVSEKLKEEFRYVAALHPEAVFTYRQPHMPVWSGCWNIATSIKDGYDMGSDVVFLVEEDILVFPDYFDYHFKTMENSAVKVSCGRSCRLFNSRYPDMYTNPGSCFTREFLDELVPHINNEFFSDMAAYFNKHLPFPPRPGLHGADDGLIRRVLLRNDWTPAFPPINQPRCAHIGCMAIENRFDFVGVVDGDVSVRIEAMRNFLKTVDRNGPKEKYVRDLDPFPGELL